MFDKKKYNSTQSELKVIYNNLVELEKIKDNLLKYLNNIQKDCKHELILVYDELFLRNSFVAHKMSKCLCCDKEIILNYEVNVDEEKTEMVYKFIDNGKINILNKNNILDLTNVISKNNLGYELYSDVKNILNNLDTNDIGKEELNKLIINSLAKKYKTDKVLRKLYSED